MRLKLDMKKIITFCALFLLATSSIFAQSKQDVTFKVDMNNYTGSFTKVYVNGTFNGWCGSCNELTDSDKDGVFEGTLSITADSIEFKYTLDGWNVQESLTPGTTCTKTTGSYTNRFLKLNGNVTLDKVCWNSCAACSKVTDKKIVFSVNMKQYTGTFSKVYVSGNFNSWSGNANELKDADGDKIYTDTLVLTNDSIEFLYTLDNWTAQEKLTAGSTCTKTTGPNTNRFEKLTGNKSLSPVCYGLCDLCTNNVTFKVDMNAYKGASFTTVNVNGTFNGWCGTCNALTDTDKDGVWETTLPLPQDSIEFLFTLDGWTAKETMVEGSSCTKTTAGFTNRFLKITSATVLPANCYESCSSCNSTSANSIQSENLINIYPNPTNGILNIHVGNKNTSEVKICITDNKGSQVYNTSLSKNLNDAKLDLSKLSGGIYFVKINTDNNVIVKQIILNNK